MSERWRDPKDLWPSRIGMAARLLPPTVESVLDVGAGAQGMRPHVEARGARYIPLDLHAGGPDVIVVDFDARPPGIPRVDFVFALGALEYSRDPRATLAWMRELAPRAVVTYSLGRVPDQAHEPLTLHELHDAVRRAGWRVRGERPWRQPGLAVQMMLELER